MNVLARAAGVLAATWLVVAVACGGGDGGPTAVPSRGSDPTVPASATAPRATATPVAVTTGFGVAGLVPRNSPAPTDQDWAAFYGGLDETGTLLGVFANWSDSPRLAGVAPRVFQSVERLARAAGVTIVAGVEVHERGPGGTVVLTLDPSDPRAQAIFLTMVDALVRQQPVAYLAVGVEVNLMAASDPAAFEAFVGLYERAYDSVKRVSPATKVFTVFQYEHLRGGALLLDGVTDRPASLDLLDRFAGRLDLVGLTSYPFLDYESPADVPADYYRDVAARAGVPVALTEVGWPAAPLPDAPQSGFGGSPEEQAAFVDRLGEIIASVPVEMALWAFAHDPRDKGPLFESLGLRENDGTERPALDRWRTLVR